MDMRKDIEERTLEIASFIIEHRCTVRDAAKHFGLSKSNVHKDVTERLRRLHPVLFAEVGAVLAVNKSERHLRGGEATRIKYLSAK